jgi:hypothetical protein
MIGQQKTNRGKQDRRTNDVVHFVFVWKPLSLLLGGQTNSAPFQIQKLAGGHRFINYVFLHLGKISIVSSMMRLILIS